MSVFKRLDKPASLCNKGDSILSPQRVIVACGARLPLTYIIAAYGF